MTQAKTSEEIWNRFQRIVFDISTSTGENKRNYLSELGEFNHKKWLPADKVEEILRNRDKVMYKKLKEQLLKSVLIEDVKKMIGDFGLNNLNEGTIPYYIKNQLIKNLNSLKVK